MEQPCSHCDQPDSSLLRVVLIGEILRANDVTLYTLADMFQDLGVFELADTDEVPAVTPGLQRPPGLRLVR